MRVPEQAVAMACAALAALAAGMLASGCAARGPVEVTWDKRDDLSKFRTWDWIDGDAIFVRTPSGDSAEVEARVSALVERALRERGLARSPGNAEFRVAALMVGIRTYQSFRHPRAVQTLYSYHDIGGYEVQADDLERRAVDRCRVAIYITGPHQERMLWRGVWEERYPDGCALHIDEAVANLIERFPR
jgi:hypothetical protein